MPMQCHSEALPLVAGRSLSSWSWKIESIQFISSEADRLDGHGSLRPTTRQPTVGSRSAPYVFKVSPLSNHFDSSEASGCTGISAADRGRAFLPSKII